MKLGKLAKFGRFAGPTAIAGLGAYELYRLTQGAKGSVNTAKSMADVQDMFAGIDNEPLELLRSEDEGVRQIADILEMQKDLQGPRTEMNPELSSLIDGYEDMIESTKGQTRPSLEQAYARMGLL